MSHNDTRGNHIGKEEFAFKTESENISGYKVKSKLKHTAESETGQ